MSRWPRLKRRRFCATDDCQMPLGWSSKALHCERCLRKRPSVSPNVNRAPGNAPEALLEAHGRRIHRAEQILRKRENARRRRRYERQLPDLLPFDRIDAALKLNPRDEAALYICVAKVQATDDVIRYLEKHGLYDHYRWESEIKAEALRAD